MKRRTFFGAVAAVLAAPFRPESQERFIMAASRVGKSGHGPNYEHIFYLADRMSDQDKEKALLHLTEIVSRESKVDGAS